MWVCGDPTAFCLAPRLGLLVELAENYTPEHTRASGDRLREWPHGVARRHGARHAVLAVAPGARLPAMKGCRLSAE